jgi:hypothetical protein
MNMPSIKMLAPEAANSSQSNLEILDPIITDSYSSIFMSSTADTRQIQRNIEGKSLLYKYSNILQLLCDGVMTKPESLEVIKKTVKQEEFA